MVHVIKILCFFGVPVLPGTAYTVAKYVLVHTFGNMRDFCSKTVNLVRQRTANVFSTMCNLETEFSNEKLLKQKSVMF